MKDCIVDDVLFLKLIECEYSDTCDFCDYPSGGSWKYVDCDKIIYHVCRGCIPSVSKSLKDSINISSDIFV